MSFDPFVAAIHGWVRDNSQVLMARISEILANSRMFPGRTVQWRPDRITDFRGTLIPASAERLIRWDTRLPTEVFRDGLRTHSPAQSFGELTDMECNIAQYVRYPNPDQPTIFVSTTRTHTSHDPYSTEPQVWTADIRRTQGRNFKYEIYAHGGLEVNPTLGTHRFEYQNEVTFPGGIRPEFIRSAIEYVGDTIIEVHSNPNFRWNASGRDHDSRLTDLPETSYEGYPVNSTTLFPDDQSKEPKDEHRRELREVGVDTDALMRGEGQLAHDPFVKTTLRPRFHRAILSNLASSGNEVYVFAETKYVLMGFDRPGSIINGPKLIVTQWPSLRTAGFAGRVDAVLPNPGNSEEFYFFCGDQYALIHVTPGTTDDYIVNGPKSIYDNWPSLRRAGFSGGVNASLPNPKNSDEAYFFCGDRYVLIHIRPGTNDDYIVNGPKPIRDNWPSLRAAGFPFTWSVDAALLNPANKNEAYFFSRDLYVLVNVAPGSTDDYIVDGPHDVAKTWTSLSHAGFY